jgi:anhydro-N-acetylmuramic acid kinase
VPVYHRAPARGLDRSGPLVVVNIGGVSNITYIDGDDVLIACDTGPGNALLDDFVLHSTGRPFDANGALAAQGQVDDAWVARALQNPFFSAAPPKSLDRNHFAALSVDGKLPADGAATLTAFTAASIAAIAPLLPKPPRAFIVAGGGARNPTLLSMLGDRVASASVESADALGWSADAMEAQAFAFLAVRSAKRLPLTFPGTTGVVAALTGGVRAGSPI